MHAPAELDLTLVIDIGKTNAKLLLLDGEGTVIESHSRANSSVPSALGYPALDVQGLAHWMQSTLRASANTQRCGHAIATTHGAAFVALSDDGLAWDPVDYEYEYPDGDAAGAGKVAAPLDAASDDYSATLSPNLPAGLNAARQLYWMQHVHPDAWQRTRTLLPYPQYWAWLLSGVACSEVTSLGCHTHLWSPVTQSFSKLAIAEGWAQWFAPLRSGWEVLGFVQPAIVTAWGLPAACQVHVGVHDSNACLARYLDSSPHGKALTIVSSGTWTVVMAPGAPVGALQAERDMLGNVDVTGRTTPTARFMGGREFAAILAGANPNSAGIDALQRVIDSQTFAFPTFSAHGGPFISCAGFIERNRQRLDSVDGHQLAEAERATLAATYCAQVTAWLIRRIWTTETTGPSTVIVEGPFSTNPVYMGILQMALPVSECYSSTDALEGTARGAWQLTRWHSTHMGQGLKPVQFECPPGLCQYLDAWAARVNLLLIT